jgi:hypothetical protein
VVEITGDSNTGIYWGKSTTMIETIASYDPSTNALEASFIADILPNRKVTGMISLAGPEDGAPLFLEDLLLVNKDALRKANAGDELSVKHLLSVHGQNNLKDSPSTLTNLFYNPAPTLAPIVSFINGKYNFKMILKKALERIQRRVG